MAFVLLIPFQYNSECIYLLLLTRSRSYLYLSPFEILQESISCMCMLSLWLGKTCVSSISFPRHAWILNTTDVRARTARTRTALDIWIRQTCEIGPHLIFEKNAFYWCNSRCLNTIKKLPSIIFQIEEVDPSGYISEYDYARPTISLTYFCHLCTHLLFHVSYLKTKIFCQIALDFLHCDVRYKHLERYGMYYKTYGKIISSICLSAHTVQGFLKLRIWHPNACIGSTG